MGKVIEVKPGVWDALFSASQKEIIVKKAVFCSDNGEIPERDAAKIRVDVRRLIKAGITSTHEICEALKQHRFYPRCASGDEVPEDIVEKECIYPVLAYKEKSSTRTFKILNLLDEGCSRVEITRALRLRTGYVATIVAQVRDRKHCSLDYTRVGLSRPGRKKKKDF